jgi:hypothetical protein
MANDIPLPADPEGFDRFFESSLASMAPDIEPALLAEIMPQVDAWRQQQAEQPSRSEAIRRLIGLGLEVGRKGIAPITPTEADEMR